MNVGLIYDFDDTLAADHEVTTASIDEVGARAQVDPRRLRQDLLRNAEELWRLGPEFELCDRIGISATEGLWGDFPGNERLRRWVVPYRRECWARALQDQGLSPDRADELAGHFRRIRGTKHRVYPEVPGALADQRRDGMRIGLITNGDRDLQFEKIEASGLGPLFDVIAVSGDRILRGQIQRGKPDGAIFRLVMREMGVERAVMFGDKMSRDIAGARAAGIPGILVRRPGVDPSRFRDAGDTPQIGTLDEVTPGTLPRLIPKEAEGVNRKHPFFL